ncbi:MAG: acetate--CoA ligase [Thermoleophilia bacterium]
MDCISPIVRRWQEEARVDPDAFWDRAARTLPWFRTWDRVLEWDFPTFRWFAGGRTNLAYAALDHHVASGDGGRAALIALDERGGRRVLTYAQLLREVERYAAALRGLGVGKGDRITLYLPVCVEAVALMLATVRIGAIHSVVFAGFGAGALGDRVRASGSRLLFTTDVTYRKGADVPLKGIVDAALEGEPHSVEHVVLLRRGAEEPPMRPGRDLDWSEFVARGEGHDGGYVEMEANEPAFILATSGTTARPKLAVHVHGGYQVGVASMARWVYGLTPNDVWWSTSDIGWIVGHSYIVYAPLLVGCTTIAYEGAIDHPSTDVLWRLMAENGVTALFTSPTAVRALMRHGSEPTRGHDLAALERVFCAGEALNAPAWEWLQKDVLGDHVPVVDHWWQTETGGPVIGNPYGIHLLPIKPGSAGVPLPGMEVSVRTPEGERCAPGEKGILVFDRPFPSLTPTLWGEPERFASDYWGKLPGHQVYFTGDSTSIDEDGYVWFAGRADEVIKIAAHRIGTVEVETAFLKHPAVAEAGVTGRPDEVRGEVISAFVVLKTGHEPSPELKRELLDTVRRELGPVAVVGDLNVVDMLPKTRSGKIMRRVLKAVVTGQQPGDITTIEDEGSVEEAREAFERMRAEIAAES